MKNVFTLLILVFGIVATTQAQVEKTLVKSVALEASANLTVALPGAVEVEEWDKDFVRVTTNLKVENMNENIVKQLVIVGRYNVETATEGQAIVITMPKVANLVTVKGVLLKEVLTFNIAAPEGYEVIIKGENVSNDMLGQTL